MNNKDVKYLNRQFYASWLTSRLIAIFALLVMFGFACACSVILWLLPLKEIKPYLVAFYEKDKQVVKVEPVELEKPSSKTLVEFKCREFVTDLHTFDGQTEAIRLKRLSTDSNLVDRNFWHLLFSKKFSILSAIFSVKN